MLELIETVAARLTVSAANELNDKHQ